MKPNKRLQIRIEAARKRSVWAQKTLDCHDEGNAEMDAKAAALEAFRAPLLHEIVQAERYLSELKKTVALMHW